MTTVFLNNNSQSLTLKPCPFDQTNGRRSDIFTDLISTTWKVSREGVLFLQILKRGKSLQCLFIVCQIVLSSVSIISFSGSYSIHFTCYFLFVKNSDVTERSLRSFSDVIGILHVVSFRTVLSHLSILIFESIVIG